jgi:hypothetical protein
MNPKTLFMETTQIPPEKTAADIVNFLVRMNASQIAMTYENQKIIGLRFAIQKDGRDVPFTLPVRTEPVYKILLKRRKGSCGPSVQQQVREQAERVAWRQLLRWIEAQFAMIDVGMVEPTQVFLPYMQGADGRTLFEVMAASQFKALPAPEVSRV